MAIYCFSQCIVPTIKSTIEVLKLKSALELTVTSRTSRNPLKIPECLKYTKFKVEPKLQKPHTNAR